MTELLADRVKARRSKLGLAVVTDLRVARAPATPEDLEALETDMLAGSYWRERRSAQNGP